MRQPTQLEMFGLLHLEIESQTKPKLTKISEPSSSNQVHTHTFYDHKLEPTLLST